MAMETLRCAVQYDLREGRIARNVLKRDRHSNK